MSCLPSRKGSRCRRPVDGWAEPRARSIVAGRSRLSSLSARDRSTRFDQRQLVMAGCSRIASTAVLQRAIDRGEISPDIALPAVLDRLYAPLYFRLTMQHEPLTAELPATL